MAEDKNYGSDNRNYDLKQVDSKKSGGIDTESYQIAMKEVLGEKKGRNFLSNRSSKKKNKRLPIFVDIIIGVLILAIAIGIVLGSFFLFRYYADDYGEESIEYVFITHSSQDKSVYQVMRNSELFMDAEDNSFYFGKVTNVDIIEGDDGPNTIIFTVTAKAKHKRGSGYVVGNERIAVGSQYTFRVGSTTIDGDIVELTKRTN